LKTCQSSACFGVIMNGWWIFVSADVAALRAGAPWAHSGSRMSIAPAETPAAVLRKARRE
jgi:hypothetical protein